MKTAAIAPSKIVITMGATSLKWFLDCAPTFTVFDLILKDNKHNSEKKRHIILKNLTIM
ncbi:hypothetical protein GCM10007203_13310 [Staphylococcus nepalensis]|nr:hypothetical protein GCM10007203_13310 [Staphylococcus nepalensis]